MLTFKGQFHVEHVRDNKVIGKYDFRNGMVTEGINHILETEFNGGTPITTWYCGLVDNASWTAFADADVMNSHATWIENEDYTSATRPEWTAGTAATRAITNAATVDFAIDASVTIKGLFITSSLTKGGTTGVLWSTGAFGAAVPMVSGDTLKITYTISVPATA
jgi:hypothetical protein